MESLRFGSAKGLMVAKCQGNFTKAMSGISILTATSKPCKGAYLGVNFFKMHGFRVAE